MSYLDKTIVDELRLIMEEDVEFLYEAYIEDSVGQLVELVTSINEKNCDKTRRLAHSLKGSSRNVGARIFSDICELLEKAAREEKLESWPSLLVELEKNFELTKNQIKLEVLQAH